MKPHPRIRKTIKWGGAAATALLVAMWIGSGWRYSALWRGEMACIVTSGGIGVERQLGIRSQGSSIYAQRFNIHLLPGWYQFTPTPDRPGPPVPPELLWQVFVPLWIPAVGTLAATVTAWRLDTLARRRARTSHCSKCSYDRAGLAAETKCPECGTGGLPA